jgi:hypothetical protein
VVSGTSDFAALPATWTIEELDACFVVIDRAGRKLAYVYFENEPGQAIRSQASHPR